MNRTYEHAWEIWIERSKVRLGNFKADHPPQFGERLYIDGTPYRIVEMEEISQPGGYEHIQWHLIKVTARDAAEKPPSRFFTSQAAKDAFEARQAAEVAA